MAFGRNPLIAADGTFSTDGATAWNTQIFGVTDAVSGGIPFFNSTTTEGTSALLASGGLVIGGGAGAAPFTSTKIVYDDTANSLTLAAGTLTSGGSQVVLTQTRNSGGTTFGAILKGTVTDTASAAASMVVEILGGAAGTTNLISVDKAGITTTPTIRSQNGGFWRLNNSGTATVSLASTATLIWCATASNQGTPDTGFSRTAAGKIAVGNGTAANASGTINAAAYEVGGTAGASFGPAAVASITVVNGIITAIS